MKRVIAIFMFLALAMVVSLQVAAQKGGTRRQATSLQNEGGQNATATALPTKLPRTIRPGSSSVSDTLPRQGPPITIDNIDQLALTARINDAYQATARNTLVMDYAWSLDGKTLALGGFLDVALYAVDAPSDPPKVIRDTGWGPLTLSPDSKLVTNGAR